MLGKLLNLAWRATAHNFNKYQVVLITGRDSSHPDLGKAEEMGAILRQTSVHSV
jgi:hypothetical protein